MDLKDEFEGGGDSPAIPAATLVIFRNDPAGGPPHLLMVERSASMSFAGGAAVFPGGRVDQADRDLAEALGHADIDEAAARIAAVRETLEETGLMVGIVGGISHEQALRARDLIVAEKALGPVLSAMGWQLDLDALVPFSRWRPKHRHLKIFDTRFYLIDLGTGAVEVEVDASENTHLFWASAADALALADGGKISIIFPTRRNLERLAQLASYAVALAHVERFPSKMITPFFEERDGEPFLAIPADAGYPVTGERLDRMQRA